MLRHLCKFLVTAIKCTFRGGWKRSCEPMDLMLYLSLSLKPITSSILWMYVQMHSYAKNHICLASCTQALVNIPAISDRSIRYDLAASKTTIDSQIQVNSIQNYAILCDIVGNR